MTWYNVKKQEFETHCAMLDPQIGDCFHEHFSYWVFVVYVEEDEVITMRGIPPCELPKDGKLKTYTRKGFIDYFSYNTNPGYFVDLHQRKWNIRGWIAREGIKNVFEKEEIDLNPINLEKTDGTIKNN